MGILEYPFWLLPASASLLRGAYNIFCVVPVCASLLRGACNICTYMEPSGRTISLSTEMLLKPTFYVNVRLW